MSKKTESKTSNLQFELVAMNLIDPNPKNKDIFNLSDIEHFANIIKEEGFTTPIEVLQKEDGRYEIISGHRRYEAMKFLGETHIPCNICQMIKKDTDKTRRLISSNLATRKITPLEMGRAIRAYHDILNKEGKGKGETRPKIAKYFNISESAVYRYEGLLKLIPELQEYCNRPSFPYSCFKEVFNLPKETQYRIYKELIELEANDKKIDANEVDKEELTLSRTRIEQVINNVVRQRENKKKREEMERALTDAEYDSDDYDDDTSLIEDADGASANSYLPANDFAEFSSRDGDGDRESISLDIQPAAPIHEDYTYFRGVDSCIATIEGYQSNPLPQASTKEFKKKLKELKMAIEKLEKSL